MLSKQDNEMRGEANMKSMKETITEMIKTHQQRIANITNEIQWFEKFRPSIDILPILKKQVKEDEAFLKALERRVRTLR